MTAKLIASCAIVAACVATCAEREEMPGRAVLSPQRSDPATEAMMTRDVARALAQKDEPATPVRRARARADAVAHLPHDCRAVARLDVPRLLDLPGARERLLPSLERSDEAPGGGLARVRDAFAQIDVELEDISHVAMCVAQLPPAGTLTAQHLTIAIAGALPQGRLVHALIRDRNGFHGVRIDEDTTAAHDPSSELYVAQARDGTVILSTDRLELAKALRIESVAAPAEREDFGLDHHKALSATLPATAVARLLLHATQHAALQQLLHHAGRTYLELDVPTRSLTLSIEMPDEEHAAELAELLEDEMRRLRAAPRHQIDADVRETLEGAGAHHDGAIAIVRVTVPHDRLAALTRDLADRLRSED